jgi:hypothetical protein
MTTYKLLRSTNGEIDVVLRNNNVFIPFAPDNTDYQEYLAWLAAGNTPISADEPETP